MSQHNQIYLIQCPYTKVPVFVGTTMHDTIHDAIQDTIQDKESKQKVDTYIRILKSEGKEPTIIILEQNFKDILSIPKEQFWINYYTNKGNILLNQEGVHPQIFQSNKFNKVNDEDPLSEVRNYVMGRRKVLKMSQQELSQKSGVGIRFIRELEQGTKTNFNTDTLLKVLHLIGNGKLSVKTTND